MTGELTKEGKPKMFKTSFYGATDRTKVACEDCDWQGEACELEGISDFSERVAPGEICPAGECPECGALAHVAKPRVEIKPHMWRGTLNGV
jgi:hypothetical protein